MTEQIKLSPCKICGHEPFVHRSNIAAKGCSFLGWIIECDYDSDYDQELPLFVEHNLTVYGVSKEEAIERWEQIAND